MNPLIVEFFETVDSPMADAAIAHALPHVDGAEFAELVELLLKRGGAVGLRTLAERYDTLPESLQRRVAVTEGAMGEALTEILKSGESQGRVNALSILRTTQNLPLAYLVAGSLSDRSALVRHSAAETLRVMVERFYDRADDIRTDLCMVWDPTVESQHIIATTLAQMKRERDLLSEAVRRGVDGFITHHQMDALYAAMLLIDDSGSALFEPRNGRRGQFTHALIEALQEWSHPRLAPFFFAAMERPEMRAALLEVLAKRRDNAFFESIFREHWRLKRPGVRQALAAVGQLAWLEYGIAPLMALPDDVHAAGIEFISLLGLPESFVLELFRGVLDFDSTPALVAVTWALTRRKSSGASSLLESFSRCDAVEAQRIARFELSRRKRSVRTGSSGSRTTDDWGRFVQRLRYQVTFDAIWQLVPQLEPDSCAPLGESAMAKVPDFSTQLRLRLCKADDADRSLGLRLIAAFRLEQAFQNEICEMASDKNDQVRADAMQALGRVGDPASRRILERGIEDEAPRVRAVAAEALAVVAGDRAVAMLTPMCDDASAVVRGAVIRALLLKRVPDAARSLLHGLRDERGDHRLAMLEIVGRMNLTAMLARVTHMSSADPDDRVRQRAIRLLKEWRRSGVEGVVLPHETASQDEAAVVGAAGAEVSQ